MDFQIKSTPNFPVNNVFAHSAVPLLKNRPLEKECILQTIGCMEGMLQPLFFGLPEKTLEKYIVILICYVFITKLAMTKEKRSKKGLSSIQVSFSGIWFLAFHYNLFRTGRNRYILLETEKTHH